MGFFRQFNNFLACLVQSQFEIVTSSVLLLSLTSCTATLTTPPDLLAPVTLVLNLKFKPCLVRIFWKDFDTSWSIPTPPIVGINSIAVTCDPNLDHTDPYNIPKTSQINQITTNQTNQFDSNHSSTNHNQPFRDTFQ